MRSGKLLVAAALSIAGLAACVFSGAPLLAQAETEQSATENAAWEFEPTETDGQIQQVDADADLFEPAVDHGRELRRPSSATPAVDTLEKATPVATADEVVGGPASAKPSQPRTDFGPLDGFQQPVTGQPASETSPAAAATAEANDGPEALFEEINEAAKSDVFGEEEEDLFAPALEAAESTPRTGVSHRRLHFEGSIGTTAQDTNASPAPQSEAAETSAAGSPTVKPTGLVRPVEATTSEPVDGTDAKILPNPISPPAPLSLPTQPITGVMDIASTGLSASTGPCVTVQMKADGTVAVGQEAKCALIVKNSGGETASNVVLEATIPDGVRLVQATPQPVEETSLSWVLGDLRSGEERVVRIRLMPKDTGRMSIRSSVRYSGQNEVAFSVVQPMLKVSLAGPEEVQVGDAAPYVVTVSNPGSGVAHDVIISARIPDGLEHRRGKHLTMQIGALSPGKSRNVRLALMAVEPGKHPLKVEAVGGSDLSDVTSAAVNVVAPMLALEITGPKTRHAGRKSRYSVVVSNPGNVITSNVRAKYRMPAGFDFVAADRGGRVATDGTIEWFVGQLAPGETARFNVTLLAKQLGDFTHQAGVVSEHGAKKAAELATRIEGVASLALTIQDRDDPVEVGQETLYEIRVANEGSKDAKNVVVTCDLPAGMKVKGIRGPVNYSTRNGRVIFGSLSTLPKGKATVYQVVVTATAGGSQRLKAHVTSDSVREPLSSEELTKVYND